VVRAQLFEMKNINHRAVTRLALRAVALIFFVAAVGHAQGSGPIRPPTPVARAPLPPSQPEKPALPPEQIIQRFAAREDEMLRASLDYNYQKTVRVEELGPGNKATGQAEIISQQAFGPDGKRYEKIIKRTESTLHYLEMERGDIGFIDAAPLFPLTTSQLPKYEITFQGKQPLDELSVYVFGVRPRALDRTHAYFSGVVWVDEQDLVIVKTIGKWVSETGDVTSPQLPFTVFETFRQQIGKNWFPAYSRSDDSLPQGDVSVPIRITIRWTDYALASGASPAAPPASGKSPENVSR
jgi:hypothetical protein